MKAFLRDTLLIIVLAAVIVIGQRAIIPKVAVIGPSMDYTLANGEQLIVNKLAYKFHQPQRGDVIVFYQPSATEDYIKRIIGLPGESVEIKDGVVYIHKTDGTAMALTEPYVTQPARYPFKGSVIPEGQYFVMGDNRNNSTDSRSGWTVPFGNIMGKAWLAVWPPGKWGLVTNYLADQKSAISDNKLLSASSR